MTFLQFKPVWKLTPSIQISIIAALYLITVIQCFFEYQNTGLMYGYPLSVSILFVPIYEEMIFHGWILGELLKYNSTKKAIIISSLLFGLWHFKNILFVSSGEVAYQMLYATLIIGPLLAWLAIRTKTIWPGVILHYVNNIGAPLSWVLLAWFM